MKNLSTVYKYWKWILISFHVPSPIHQTCDSQDRGGSTDVFYGFGVMFSIGEEPNINKPDHRLIKVSTPSLRLSRCSES